MNPNRVWLFSNTTARFRKFQDDFPLDLITLKNERCLLEAGLAKSQESDLAAYRKKDEVTDLVKGHNHSVDQKCGPHCPRNAHYKGPIKRPDMFHRNK